MSEPEWTCPACQAVFRTDYLRCPADGSLLEPAERDPLPGTILGERYRVGERLGEGATGRVYRGEHLETGRAVALKITFGEVAAKGQTRQRLRREARSASRLAHPGIVEIIDIHEQGALLVLVMGLVRGESLAARVERDGPLGVEAALPILRALAEALGHAHDHGILHRDLKPENVLVDERGAPRLVDFGLALPLRSEQARLTEHGTLVGTPAFAAPEQLLSSKVDERADLYGLGALAYFLFSGRPPFEGSPLQVVQRVASSSAPRLPDSIPDGPRELVDRLLSRRPEDRPRSAQALLDALDALESPEEAAPEPPPLAAGARPSGLVLGLLALGAGVLAASLWATGFPAMSPPQAVESETDAGPALSAATSGDGSSLSASPVDAGSTPRDARAGGIDAALDPDAAEAPAPPEASPLDAAEAPPPPEASPLDAAEAPAPRGAPPLDAGEMPTPRRARSRRTERRQAPTRRPSAPISTEALLARHRAVRSKLEQASARAPERTAPLMRRYLELPLQRALSDPSARPPLMRALDAIEAEIPR